VAFEQVKARLRDLGMFEDSHKKPLPTWPRRIGIVTSEGGAALQDVINILSRRYPLCALVLSPAPVQGRDAPAALTRALQTLDSGGNCDVIILGRGGGSAEDLAAFNDEGLARAVFAARTPIVSAVGHETDYTICDLVADLRAPTPSAAAELCTPSAEQLAARLAATHDHLAANASALLAQSNERLARHRNHRTLRSPLHIARVKQERLDFLSQSLYNKKCIFIRRYSDAVASRAGLLDSLSPLRVLGRGYAVAFSGGHAVASVTNLTPGQNLTVRFQDGEAETTVQYTHRKV
jgi:exodeoxyribonuclease VII large subunit